MDCVAAIGNGVNLPSMSAKRATILGIQIDDVTLDEVIERVSGWLANEPDRLHHIVTTNPEFLVAARKSARFRTVLASADLATADGVGVLIAARVLGEPLRTRVTGVELVEGLAARRAANLRLFLLGAGPGVAECAANRLRERFPGVEISGVWDGSPQPGDAHEILRRVKASAPTILLVAYGAPSQDIWISTHRDELAACGIVIAIGIGGAFDFLAGAVPRAPQLVRRFGFEWLYRLIRQPWRWRRQLALPFFVLLILIQRLRPTRPEKQERVW
jgi:N-acetylglucosaminyldiphosphoundecaprenol N-acetyl-beta-D-mannosaminyltransferase